MTDYVPQDPLGERLFTTFMERRPACRAVQLTPDNIWDVALWLMAEGYQVKAGNGPEGLSVKVSRGADFEPFTARVGQGDAIVYRGGDVILIDGPTFLRQWEPE